MGAFNAQDVVDQFSAIGPARLARNGASYRLEGEIKAENGDTIAYLAPLYGCNEKGENCDTISLRYDWTGNDAVRCLIDAWGNDFSNRERANANYAFDSIRLMHEIINFRGADPVPLKPQMQIWQRDLRAFYALTRQVDTLCR